VGAARLIEVKDGVALYATSAIDARFLYREIFEMPVYTDIALGRQPFVMDVGANIGMFLLFIKSRWADAEILAFEPVPDLADAAQRNVELRGLTGVQIHTVALGAVTQGGVPFHYYPLVPSVSTRYPQAQGRLWEAMRAIFPARAAERMAVSRQLTVDVARLSTFLPPDRPVDLLKIDAVGSELDILGGIDAPHWPHIRQLVLDVQDVEGRLTNVCWVLQDQGFAVRARAAPGADKLTFHVYARRSDSLPEEVTRQGDHLPDITIGRPECMS
jgi:FkbM family methyltransferase